MGRVVQAPGTWGTRPANKNEGKKRSRAHIKNKNDEVGKMTCKDITGYTNRHMSDYESIKGPRKVDKRIMFSCSG